MAIIRLRIAILTVMGVVVSLAAGNIFDQTRWELVVAPLIVGVVGMATTTLGVTLRLVGMLLSVVGAVVAVAYLGGGDLADVPTAFTSGPQRLLTTEWPSPARAELLATTAVWLATLAALAIELARQERLHLSPLVPIGAVHVLVIALSAPRGAELWWLLPLGLLAMLFAAFRPGLELRERWTLLAGERRLVPLSAIAVMLAAAIALPVAFATRADPRRNDVAQSTATLLDPIEATLALQAINPPIDLHEIDLDTASDTGTGVVPRRWRTAALVDFDGQRWAPALTLRPIGRRLTDDPVDPDDAVSGTVSFLVDDLQLFPLPGAAITIDADIETDADRTLVRLTERPDVGDEVSFSALVDPDSSAVTPGSVESRAVDETVSSLTEFAEAIIAEAADGGPTDILEQLTLMAQTMRENFVLDSDASGGGLQRALIIRFIRDTRRGNAEQFATAFVLLARSLGVNARVATGFDVPFERVSDSSTLVLTSADAAVWPEVSVGGEWLAFDPVPDTEVSDAAIEPPEPQVQTPAAPQPPIAPPPESTDEPEVTETDDAESSADALPTVVRIGLQAAAVIGALLIPVLLLIAIVLGIKHRRRRRRLAGPPEVRINGAWAVATNRLIDAGMAITPSATNDEIADVGVEFAPSADRELHRLATLASAATFGSPARPDLLADDATACLGQVETSMSEARTRWQRLRWRLSLRSLQRSTRSPV